MPSPEVRKFHQRCSDLIQAAGAQIVRKERTGSGHVKITFRYGSQEKFHILPATPSCYRGQKNTVAELRRQLEGLTGTKPTRVFKHAPTKQASNDGAQVVRLHVETPKGDRLTAERRKELAKEYLQSPSIYFLSKKTGITETTLRCIIKAHKGQAAEKLAKEENELRYLAAKKAQSARQKRHPSLRNPSERAKLAKHAFRMYFLEHRPMHEVAKLIGVSQPTAAKLAQEGDY